MMMTTILLCLLALGQPRVIGIMGAMEVELDLISKDMVIEEVDTIATKIYKSGKIYGVPCVMARAGVGKVGAAQTAQMLITEYGVDVVIFTGVAGGINPQLDIGDIVVSSNVVHHDFGQILPDAFTPYDTVGYFADTVLVGLALQAAGNIELQPIPEEMRGADEVPEVILGRVATGDQFISSEVKRLWIEETFHADCVEMEGAAVAQICAVNDVPFVIIRSLSDLANEEAEVDFEVFVVYAATNSSLLVKEMLKLLGQ
jgi:adenosylhomocysteine nucleosidase